MQISNLLDSCRKRIPWPTMRVMLKACDLHTGRGWEDTMNKLIAQSKDETFLDCFKKLQQYYENHLLVGEKSVQFFEASRSQINNLIDTAFT